VRAPTATLLGALLLALAAWLLAPIHGTRASGPGPAALRAVLLDASASAVRPRPGWRELARERLAAEASEAEALGEELVAVLLGSEPRRVFGPAPAAELRRVLEADEALPRPPPEIAAGTRVDAALALLEPLVLDPERPAGRLSLWSDGTLTGPDPRARLARWLARSVDVRSIPMDPPELGDAVVRDLRLPPRIEEGAPLAARIGLGWRSGGRQARPPDLEVEARVEDRLGIRTLRAPAACPTDALPDARGELAWAVSLDLGPAASGHTAVEVVLRSARPDPSPENDRASATCRCGGDLLVGVVASEEARVGALLGLGLAGDPGGLAGLQAGAVALERLDARLPGLDLLVTLDLHPDRLPAPAVEAFLRAGGGWLHSSGWDDLARPGWGGAGQLLPLEPDPSPGPERDVLLFVDGSGSMAGEPFDRLRGAARELCRASPAGDRVVLEVFTDRLHGARVLREPGAPLAGAALEALAAHAPGGPTDLLGSLEALAGAREAAGRPALVLLLSDGRDESGRDPGPDGPERLAERLRAAGARLVPIAVGPDEDPSLLERLTAPGEAIRTAAALGELERVFRREVHRDRVLEGVLIPRVAPGGALGFDAEGLRDAWRGARLDPIRRAVRCRVREGAEAVLAVEAGEPLLALGRVGAGRVASLATAPRPGWAPLWTGSEAVFGPLLRTLGRGARAEGARLSISGAGLAIEGLAEGWSEVVEVRIRPLVGGWPAATSRLGLPLGRVGLDPRSRREGPWPGELAGLSGLVRVEVLAGGPGEGAGRVFLAAVPGVGELAEPPRRLSVPAGVPGWSGPGTDRRASHPLGVPALILALAMLAIAALPRRRARPADQGSSPGGR